MVFSRSRNVNRHRLSFNSGANRSTIEGYLCGQIRLVAAGRTSQSCVVSGCTVFMAHILDPMMMPNTTGMMLLILDKSSPLSNYVWFQFELSVILVVAVYVATKRGDTMRRITSRMATVWVVVVVVLWREEGDDDDDEKKNEKEEHTKKNFGPRTSWSGNTKSELNLDGCKLVPANE